jgi:hypothetical protein
MLLTSNPRQFPYDQRGCGRNGRPPARGGGKGPRRILGSFYAPDQAAAIVAANKHLFVVGFGMSVWIYP